MEMHPAVLISMTLLILINHSTATANVSTLNLRGSAGMIVFGDTDNSSVNLTRSGSQLETSKLDVSSTLTLNGTDVGAAISSLLQRVQTLEAQIVSKAEASSVTASLAGKADKESISGALVLEQQVSTTSTDSTVSFSNVSFFGGANSSILSVSNSLVTFHRAGIYQLGYNVGLMIPASNSFQHQAHLWIASTWTWNSRACEHNTAGVEKYAPATAIYFGPACSTVEYVPATSTARLHLHQGTMAGSVRMFVKILQLD